MSGWRKRQIADAVESNVTFMDKFTQWFVDNNVEITWSLMGFLFCDMIEQIVRQNFWHAGWNFFIISINYFLRKEGFGK
jgi:hypothetical protein